MIILRVLLYLICIISIGWSVLIFGGPPILKGLISGYSNGALKPDGITVSPRLDIGINRLEFNFESKVAGRHIEGFSRAIEIAWSLSGEKPLLEISLGPTVVKDYATVDRINFYTPSFQKIDWQNISFAATIDSAVVSSIATMRSVTLGGNFNPLSAKASSVKIEAEELSGTYRNSSYSASLLRSDISELNLNAHLTEQLFLSTFELDAVVVSEPDLTIPKAIVDILVTENDRGFRVDLENVKLSEFGGFVENFKVDGSFDKSNVLQKLYIASVDSVPFKKSPKFLEISASVNKSGDEQYQVFIEGDLDQFELINSKNYIGSLPQANFVIDLVLDRSVSKLSSMSKINFNNLSGADINAYVDIDFHSELLTNLGCGFPDCKLSDFELRYNIDIDDDWVMGGANCPRKYCSLSDMEHIVRTSNTVNIFTILNKVNILSPISSVFFFNVVSSGQKISDGHELKFQF